MDNNITAEEYKQFIDDNVEAFFNNDLTDDKFLKLLELRGFRDAIKRALGPYIKTEEDLLAIISNKQICMLLKKYP